MIPVLSVDACEMRSRFARLCWPARCERRAPATPEWIRRSYPSDPTVGAQPLRACACATGYCSICN